MRHTTAAQSEDKLGNFLLRRVKAEAKHLIAAPFLGETAFASESVPEGFLDDYLEFHRAYRAGFVHWLQQNGMKAKAASAERFRELLLGLMTKQAAATFENLCEQLYGIPLSAKAPETDTLERRYLAWIAENSRG